METANKYIYFSHILIVKLLLPHYHCHTHWTPLKSHACSHVLIGTLTETPLLSNSLTVTLSCHTQAVIVVLTLSHFFYISNFKVTGITEKEWNLRCKAPATYYTLPKITSCEIRCQFPISRVRLVFWFLSIKVVVLCSTIYIKYK